MKSPAAPEWSGHPPPRPRRTPNVVRGAPDRVTKTEFVDSSIQALKKLLAPSDLTAAVRLYVQPYRCTSYTIEPGWKNLEKTPLLSR